MVETRPMLQQPSNLTTILPIPISTIIAYTHPIPSGFARMLSELTNINVVFACSRGSVAAAGIRQFAPDVALLDIEIVDLNLPDILSSIAADGLKTKVVCLTASTSGRDLTGAIAMGANGILFKDAEPDKIVECVRDVFHGKGWFPAARDAPSERKMERRRHDKHPIRALSERERQIAFLVCDGFSNKQLGVHLNITEGTIKAHLHNIYRKLGVRNRAALSALAMTTRGASTRRASDRRSLT
jgi:two-component system, NarL family, nitrate/nitrite response regulator NarL